MAIGRDGIIFEWCWAVCIPGCCIGVCVCGWVGGWVNVFASVGTKFVLDTRAYDS